MNKIVKGLRVIGIVIFIISGLVFASARDQEDTKTFGSSSISAAEGSNMQVHFIDVGQGDAILVTSDGRHMLVDAGDNHKSEELMEYLDLQGVETLDYVIGTHPHADHIGGMDVVIENYQIETLIMPKVASDTKTFEDVLVAAADKGLKITEPIVGAEYTLGNAVFVIIAPNDSYREMNNSSVGIKLINGNNSFIMYGDGEIESEYDIISNGIDTNADVLKAGHHGSSTSTSQAILKAINPRYVVISVGENNKYDHPHDEVLQKLKEQGAQIFRTDRQGTIVAVSDGTDITFTVSR